MTAEIGRVLGGRYRLVAPIGMGASAQVYLADDVRLRRRVALKMLHDALAGDAEFLRRFRAEARAAAALSHPNVMAVYDWGDDETAFIVTEYLGGGSLRALLDRGEQLSPSQALTIGLEATRALDYAHRRGFVHRDIKPANLLFGEEQRLRIADFGLARALAEAGWTEPQGAMLGTARYASPEQAKGEKLSGKADVYSLALVLVEAVTGEVPFAADTTLGTLMARVDKHLEVPDSLGPLQEVLARAGHPDPEQRIDAKALATGLLRAAKSLPRPAALPLAGALPPSGQLAVDADPTIHAPLMPAAEPDLTAEDLDLAPPDWVNRSDPQSPMAGVAGLAGLAGAAVAGAAATPEVVPEPPSVDATDATAPIIDLRTSPPAVPPAIPPANREGPAWSDAPAPVPEPVDRIVDPTAKVTVPAAAGAVGGGALAPPAFVPPLAGGDHPGSVEPPERSAGRRRWPWVLVVLAVLLTAGGAAAALLSNDDNATPQRLVVLPVPTLAGRSQATAQAVAKAAGWTSKVVTERRDGTIKGQVLGSQPEPGTRLARGKEILLTVSAGQTEVAVPTDLAGKPLDQASAELDAVGLKVATARSRYDEGVAKGSVIGVVGGTPAKLEKGSTVKVVVSNGPEPRTVPSGLVGGTEAEAKAALGALGLKVAVNESFSDTATTGDVISQSPRPGTQVPKGSTVTIEVSKGPELVVVPDVTGATSPAGAAQILRNAGLVPGSVSGPAVGSPIGTTPGRGTKVKKGSTVDILLG